MKINKTEILIGLLLLIPSLSNAQGTCASPDGAMLSISTPPASYQELEDSGYCIDGINTTQWVDMCFTFTPTLSTIDLNAGFSSNCNITQFDLPNSILYDNTCTTIGAGTSFNLTRVDEEYTWCLKMKANGGPTCEGIDRICPYYTQTTVLPIHLVYLECDSGEVIWQTASEINNDFYSLYSSEDLNFWAHEIDIDGAGNKSTSTYYHYYDSDCTEDLYYMLEQTDFDGKQSFEGIVHCECSEFSTPEYTIEEYNVLGQIYEGGGIKVIKISKGNRVVYKKIIKL